MPDLGRGIKFDDNYFKTVSDSANKNTVKFSLIPEQPLSRNQDKIIPKLTPGGFDESLCDFARGGKLLPIWSQGKKTIH